MTPILAEERWNTVYDNYAMPSVTIEDENDSFLHAPLFKQCFATEINAWA